MNPLDLECRLESHPAIGEAVLAGATVRLSAGAAGWRLVFRLTGGASALRLPATAAPLRCDGLWRHTCCELFVAAVGVPGYHEFNFSPSRSWAAYAFSSPRQRAGADPEGRAPVIVGRTEADAYRLEATIDPAMLPQAAAYDVGLAVVAEATDGRLAYWALRHPAPQPDFHHRDTFALRLGCATEIRA